MGHIVSSLAFRLGNTRTWVDEWYLEKLYYSFFLHAASKIRYFCIYFFHAKHYDRKAIFFSHFDVLKCSNYLNVEVYYYDGKLEDEWEDYKWELYIKFYYIPENMDPETRVSYRRYATFKLFNIVGIVLNFVVYKKKKWLRDIQGLIFHCFKKFRIKVIQNFFDDYKNKKRTKLLKKRIGLKFMFFLICYILLKKNLKLSSVFLISNKFMIVKRLYYLAFTYRYNLRWANGLSKSYSRLMERFLSFKYKVKMVFYLTDNNCVNARFLSRYIARKLKQGSFLRPLLKPIKKELRYLMRLSRIPKRSFAGIAVKKFLKDKSFFINKKELYRSFLNYFYNKYKKINYIYYKKYNIYFTLDMIIKSIWFNNLISNKNEKKEITTKYLYLYKAWLYFYKNIIYLSIFEYKFLINNITRNIFLPKYKKAYLSSWSKKFVNLLNSIYIALYVQKLTIMEYYPDPINERIFDDKFIEIFRVVNINHKRYFKFLFSKYVYKSFFKVHNVNYLRARINYVTRGNNLIGYKMKLAGRFSRKQRAGHLWFSKGKAPLNTLSALVDYAYYSIPIINSVISVRIWLYKSIDKEYQHYLRFN